MHYAISSQFHRNFNALRNALTQFHLMRSTYYVGLYMAMMASYIQVRKRALVSLLTGPVATSTHPMLGKFYTVYPGVVLIDPLSLYRLSDFRPYARFLFRPRVSGTDHCQQHCLRGGPDYTPGEERVRVRARRCPSDPLGDVWNP